MAVGMQTTADHVEKATFDFFLAILVRDINLEETDKRNALYAIS
jgi:hypothetical protein